ncbi:MAG: Rpp14/Pop5 family protein [Candidatus Hodarchaeales archaeon]
MTKVRMERPRYFIVNYSIDRKRITEKEIWYVLSSTSFQLFGLKGVAEMGLFLSKYFTDLPLFIVRVAHRHVDKLHAVLCCISQLDNEILVCNTIAKAGTLEKAMKIALSKAKTIPILSNTTSLDC